MEAAITDIRMHIESAKNCILNQDTVCAIEELAQAWAIALDVEKYLMSQRGSGATHAEKSTKTSKTGTETRKK